MSIDFLINNFYIISGCILTCALTAYLVQRNNRKNEFNSAALKFHNTFLTELIGLYPTPVDWPSDKSQIIDILEAKFPKLQASVAEFYRVLPWYKKNDFLKQWNMYRVGKGISEDNHQYYWQYVPHTGAGIENGRAVTFNNLATYQSNFKKNIDNVLKYAK
jgi:hypothetical protein